MWKHGHLTGARTSLRAEWILTRFARAYYLVPEHGRVALDEAKRNGLAGDRGAVVETGKRLGGYIVTRERSKSSPLIEGETP